MMAVPMADDQMAAPQMAAAPPPSLQKRLQDAEVAESTRRLEMWIALPASGGGGGAGGVAENSRPMKTLSFRDSLKPTGAAETSALQPAASARRRGVSPSGASSVAPSRDDVEAALMLAGGRIERSQAVSGRPGWLQESCALPASRLQAFLDALHELGLTPQEASSSRATVMAVPPSLGIVARPTSSSREAVLTSTAGEISQGLVFMPTKGKLAMGHYALREAPGKPPAPSSQAGSGARDAKPMTRLTLIIIQP
jgi:hypothetical protein